MTARVCGKGEVNLPFAILHFKANVFVTARLRQRRQTCRLRFCALRQIFFITARDCGKGEVNVPFAVLRVKANALTARVCGKGAENVPFAILHVKANIFYYRTRLRQRRGKRAVCGFAR